MENEACTYNSSANDIAVIRKKLRRAIAKRANWYGRMRNLLTWEFARFLIALIPILGGWWWFRMPSIIFGRPKNTAGEDFLTWWHVPIEIRPRFFQWKSIDDCSISVYIHGGGVGTIEKEINLCWRTGNGPQRSVTIERNSEYLVPVSLRSTHWTAYSVYQDRDRRSPLIVPPRIAFLCDEGMMLGSKIPEKGLDNEYYFSFRIRRLGKTVRISGLYELLVPSRRAENAEFTFEKKS